MKKSPRDVTLAKARVRLMQEANAHPRTVARRFPDRITPKKLGALPDVLVVVAADQERRTRVLSRASALYYAPFIAAAISPDKRAEIFETIGEDTRAFAVLHRNSGIVANIGTPFSQAYADTLAQAAMLFSMRLPAALAGRFGPVRKTGEENPKLDICLDIALAEEAI